MVTVYKQKTVTLVSLDDDIYPNVRVLEREVLKAVEALVEDFDREKVLMEVYIRCPYDGGLLDRELDVRAYYNEGSTRGICSAN